MDSNGKCAMDHILDAQNKGEINEDNVLYIVENINVAGNSFGVVLFPTSPFNFPLSNPLICVSQIVATKDPALSTY